MLGRQTVRRLAQEAGFSLVDQTKFVTAASELARNALIYGGGGELKWETLARRNQARRAAGRSRTRGRAFPISSGR